MQKQLLTNGNVFKRTDGRWCGVVWFRNEQGERKRKSFSGTTKQEVNKKIKDYIAAFEDANSASHESKKRLQESMQKWLERKRQINRDEEKENRTGWSQENHPAR